MIRFVVLFHLKDHTTTTIHAVYEQIKRLDGAIDSLESMEVGSNLTYSERSYDIAATFTFASLEALHHFEHDPLHIDVVESIKPFVQKINHVVYQQPKACA